MEMLELLLIVVKIIILSSIYATVILLIVLFLSKTIKLTWTKKFVDRKLRFWLLTHLIVSVLLFVTAFSYWQDTGIGDNSKIPVGYGQTIQSEDFEWTYFYPDPDKTEPNKDELIIGNYKIIDRFLCAEVSHQNTNSPSFDYIVYDLKNKSLKTFNSKQEYSSYASKNVLPQAKDFYDFRKHYHEYLNNRPKWKTWLLP
jgi:energy-coupling factor transporter transmembrane protein EcfT